MDQETSMQINCNEQKLFSWQAVGLSIAAHLEIIACNETDFDKSFQFSTDLPFNKSYLKIKMQLYLIDYEGQQMLRYRHNEE